MNKDFQKPKKNMLLYVDVKMRACLSQIGPIVKEITRQKQALTNIKFVHFNHIISDLCDILYLKHYLKNFKYTFYHMKFGEAQGNFHLKMRPTKKKFGSHCCKKMDSTSWVQNLDEALCILVPRSFGKAWMYLFSPQHL